LIVFVKINIFTPLGAGLGHCPIEFLMVWVKIAIFPLSGLVWGTVQVGFDGSGRVSHFYVVGGWSEVLCRSVLMVWVKIAIFLPSGAGLGHSAGGF
jgi:hypothetical protein